MSSNRRGTFTLILLFTALLLLAQVDAQEPKARRSAQHRLTEEELLKDYRSEDFGNVAWVGGSHRLVTAVDNKSEPNLRLITVMDVDSGEQKVLASGLDPHPSYDGKWILFVSGKSDASGRLVDRQLWVVPSDGSAPARQVTHQPHGFSFMDVYAFGWSRDGSKIVIPVASDESRVTRGDSATVAPTVQAHYSDHSQSQSTALWVFDVATGNGRKVATFPGDYIESPTWTSPGKILCTPSQGLAGITDLVSIDPETGKVEILYHAVNRQQLGVVLSPDQKQIALTFDPDPTDARYPYHHEIALMPAGGGEPKVLTHDFIATAAAHWDPAGDGVWVTGYYPAHLQGPGRQLYHVSLRNGEAQPITSADESVRHPAVSADGKFVAYTRSQFNGLSSLMVSNRDGSQRRELVKLTSKGESLDLGQVKTVSWNSTDGLKLYGLLYLPSSGEARNLPLLVDIHGGPTLGADNLLGPLLFNTSFERSYWTGKGYAVFAIDYRQSSIYGWDKLTEARRAHENFDRDANDINSGIQSLLDAGIADPKRVIGIGHSYGSCEINWLVTHANPFAAAISYDGCGAPESEFAATSLDGDNGSMIWTYDGYPWTNPESYRKQSAVTYAGQIHTPTLFVVAGFGLGRFAQGEQTLYEASRAKGIPSGYILYPDEPHVIQKLENQQDLLKRSTEWIERFSPAHE